MLFKSVWYLEVLLDLVSYYLRSLTNPIFSDDYTGVYHNLQRAIAAISWERK